MQTGKSRVDRIMEVERIKSVRVSPGRKSNGPGGRIGNGPGGLGGGGWRGS